MTVGALRDFFMSIPPEEDDNDVRINGSIFDSWDISFGEDYVEEDEDY